jgi:hypothetical protein
MNAASPSLRRAPCVPASDGMMMAATTVGL